MDNLPSYVRKVDDNTWRLLILAKPGAKKSAPAGETDGRLGVRLAAPATENKANKELVAFIAEILGLRPSRVTLESGDTGRQKRLLIRSEQEPDWSRLETQA